MPSQNSLTAAVPDAAGPAPADARNTREQALVAVVAAITDVMLVYLDRDFNFVWVNQAYADTCRMAPDEMVGQNHFVLYPNAENEAIFRRVRDTGVAVFRKDKPFEFPDQPERGVTYWDWSLSADRDAAGDVAGLVFSLRETTAFVRARQAEDVSTRRYRQLFENIGEGFALHEIVTDATGKPVDYRFLEANPGFERLTGIPRTQLLGRRVSDVLPGIEAHWIERFGQVALSGEPTTFESYSQPLGRWFRVHAYQPAPRQFATIFSDMSERKAAETQLIEARDEAERQTRAKSVFLANMSHEIRTPLHIITGLAHLLRKHLSNPVQRERAEQICLSTEHLLALINDILDLSKIESDRLILAPCDFRLGSVLDMALRMFESPAVDKGLTPQLTAAPALHALCLHGDPLRLAQVLINLCSNAVKFTERGSVRLAVELLAETNAHVSLRFSVEDTGIGIAAADQERIFQPFVQADASTTRIYGGSGLGLAICRRLVAMMGGTLCLDSQPGRGSRLSFDLDLPRATDEVSADTTAADIAGATATTASIEFIGRKVLLVEDHPLSQDILFEMLDELGCDVEVAGDGAEALACATGRHYDLILMDMQMPKMDGLAATAAIRELPGHAATPIVALTANAFAEDRQRCLAAGMSGHIGKPVTPAALAECLCRWLPSLADPGGGIDLREHDLGRSLLAIPGLEIPAAMCRSPDDLANYRTQLQRFIRMHGEDMAQLRRHLLSGERDAAHGVAHDLKGISGLLGVRQVAELAGQLADGLRLAASASDETTEIAACCERELFGLAAAIAELTADQPAPSRG